MARISDEEWVRRLRKRMARENVTIADLVASARAPLPPEPEPEPTPEPEPEPEPEPVPEPEPEPTPEPPPRPAKDEIRLTPSDDLAKVAAYHPPNTRFILASGTYPWGGIKPKDGQEFIGSNVTITGAHEYCFYGSAADVVLEGLTVEGYNPPQGRASVNARDGSGWEIRDLIIRGSKTGGLYLGEGCVGMGCLIEDNGQIGVKGKYAGPQLLSSVVRGNNTLRTVDYTSEAGGSKFTHTVDAIVKGCTFADNYGPGIWFDINNDRVLIVDNEVNDNADIGIFHEVSCGATIRRNIVRRNGFVRYERHGWSWGAGICIAASGPATVEENTVQDNAVAIALIQQDRGEQDCAGGKPTVHDVTVRANTIGMGSGHVGARDTTGDHLFTDRANVFAGNVYTMGSDAKPFRWAGKSLTHAEWKAYHPQD